MHLCNGTYFSEPYIHTYHPHVFSGVGDTHFPGQLIKKSKLHDTMHARNIELMNIDNTYRNDFFICTSPLVRYINGVRKH